MSDSLPNPDAALESELRRLSAVTLADHGFTESLLKRLPPRLLVPTSSVAPYVVAALLTAAAGGVLGLRFGDTVTQALASLSAAGDEVSVNAVHFVWLCVFAVSSSLCLCALALPEFRRWRK